MLAVNLSALDPNYRSAPGKLAKNRRWKSFTRRKVQPTAPTPSDQRPSSASSTCRACSPSSRPTCNASGSLRVWPRLKAARVSGARFTYSPGAFAWLGRRQRSALCYGSPPVQQSRERAREHDQGDTFGLSSDRFEQFPPCSRWAKRQVNPTSFAVSAALYVSVRPLAASEPPVDVPVPLAAVVRHPAAARLGAVSRPLAAFRPLVAVHVPVPLAAVFRRPAGARLGAVSPPLAASRPLVAPLYSSAHAQESTCAWH